MRCCLAYRSDKLLARIQKAISLASPTRSPLCSVRYVPTATFSQCRLRWGGGWSWLTGALQIDPQTRSRPGRWKFITQSAIDMVWVCPEPLAPMTMIGSGFSGGLY